MKISLEQNQAEVLKKGKNYHLSSFNDKRKRKFYGEMGTLLRASIDYNKALDILIKQEKSSYIKKKLTLYKNKILKGKSLYEIFSEDPSFSKYEIYSIKAGEETRRLTEILEELESFFEKRIKLKRQIISVLTYPVFVLTITIGVLYFMLNYVVPMFSEVFRQFGNELPEITKFIQRVSENLNFYLLVLLSAVATIVGIHYFFRSNPDYKKFMNKILLKLPLIGDFVRKTVSVKFYTSLNLLLSSKVSLLEALILEREIVSFHLFKEEIEKSINDIKRGGTLRKSFQNSLIIGKRDLTFIEIGEEVNELDKMFLKLTKQTNEEIEIMAKNFSSLLEPIMITVIGLIVGFILIAMYYPMFSLSKVIT